MSSLRELRRATAAALCVECGKCSTTCPLARFGTFSAARTMSMHEPESEFAEYAEAVESCLTCGSCEIRCPQGVRYTDYVLGLRAVMPEQHRLPRPHGEIFQVAAKLTERGDKRSLPAWLDNGLEVSEEGEIGLFVGCLPLFDTVFGNQFGVQTIEIARSAVRLLNHLGIAPVLVAGEQCCGHDLLWSGESQSFTELAQANVECFQERAVSHLLTTCAECCRTWQLDYPKVVSNDQLRVQHLSEFLAARLGSGELSFKATANGRVTYQDPCRLGRHLGVVEAPRDLLEAVPGAEFVEMDQSGRDGLCCGTAGFVRCDAISRQLQSARLRDAADTGASRLLTACPKCLLHFHCAQTEDRRRGLCGSDVQVEDLTVYLATHLATAESSPQLANETAAPRGEEP